MFLVIRYNNSLGFFVVPSIWVLKDRYGGAAKGKTRPIGIGGVPHNEKEVLFMFSKHVGVKDSNEGKVLAILKPAHIFSSGFLDSLIL